MMVSVLAFVLAMPNVLLSSGETRTNLYVSACSRSEEQHIAASLNCAKAYNKSCIYYGRLLSDRIDTAQNVCGETQQAPVGPALTHHRGSAGKARQHLAALNNQNGGPELDRHSGIFRKPLAFGSNLYKQPHSKLCARISLDYYCNFFGTSLSRNDFRGVPFGYHHDSDKNEYHNTGIKSICPIFFGA
jgi:hypothetical protein